MNIGLWCILWEIYEFLFCLFSSFMYLCSDYSLCILSVENGCILIENGKPFYRCLSFIFLRDIVTRLAKETTGSLEQNKQ